MSPRLSLLALSLLASFALAACDDPNMTPHRWATVRQDGTIAADDGAVIATPQHGSPPSPLVLETSYCLVYRNVDRDGTVSYVAESRQGSLSSFANPCSGIAVVAARAEGGAP